MDKSSELQGKQTIVDDNLIFSSEVKAILEHPKVENVIDKIGIAELFGIGPSHSPGITPFKEIKELEPAHFLIYNKDSYILLKHLIVGFLGRQVHLL